MREDFGTGLRAAVAIGMLLLATSAIAATPAYVGTWAESAAKCKLPSDTIDAPIVLKAKSYDQFESHCDFTSVRRAAGAWQIRAKCNADGAISRDRLTLWATRKVLSMKYNSSRTVNYTRCK
jgi:hypothetical protein